MPYPEILSRRMPYDIDGTEVCYWANTLGSSQSWLSSEVKQALNLETKANNLQMPFEGGTAHYIFFWFPEEREIELLHFFATNLITSLQVAGSRDSANGLDGTWENATITGGYPSKASDFSWRDGMVTISFSEPKKVIRIRATFQYTATSYYQTIHLYGKKKATETPDDILFLKDSTNEFTAIKDWGDRPEGTVEYSSFRVKNSSTTKIANSINIQLNHEDFAISWNEEGPWVTFLNIESLGPGQVSSPVYVRNLLGPPLLILGPKATRVIATIGSWT